MALDIDKIKEAAARYTTGSHPDMPDLLAYADEDRALLLAAVPDLLADRVTMLAEIERLTRQPVETVITTVEALGLLREIARLKTLAREGWQAAHRAYEDGGVAPVRILVALKEIEAAS